MQFREDGADIPSELIEAVADGSATFLCGAGVSYRAGLPLFEALTTRVYELLGEKPDEEPAERNAMERKEFDRALRSLEKRTHRLGTESRVRKTVSQLLAAPAVPLPDHVALLQLSKDIEGRSRLLTTNFDTLFERAAQSIGLVGVQSHAGKSIPKPNGERDFGVLHLHGRVGDPVLGLDETDLILTSADFGDAYLRDGWASHYIEDRMRLGTLVLVGYQAEDTAMRLLLEALDADRKRFRDLRNIYAIEKSAADSAALWKAKGIKPIEFTNYDLIYETLAEWVRYAANPDEYGRIRMKTILTGAA